jgi:hypothetical protein
MVLREIFTKWGIQVNDSGLKKMESGINGVKDSLVKIAAVGVAASGVLFGVAKSVADIGDETAKTAKSLGINTQALQELQFAAGIGGVKTSDFNNSLKKFSKNILEARRGTVTYTRAFEQLGIGTDVINNKQLKTEDLIGVMAEAFSGMKDGVEKTGLAMELFGRSGPRLLPLMNEGKKGIEALRKEAQMLGGVMNKDLLAQSEEFQDSMLRMQTVISGIRNEVGAKLIPIINKVTDSIKIWFLANRAIITQKLDSFMETLISLATTAYKIFRTLYTSVNGLVQIFGGWESVIRTVSLALMILFGAQLLIGIGNMAQGIFMLILTMNKLGVAAILTSAKLMIIPLLIGAAVVALGLLFEDLYRFAIGDKSVFGQIENEIDGLLGSMDSWFASMPGFIQGIIRIITLPIRTAIGAIKTLGGVVGAITAGDFGGALDAVGEGFMNLVASGPSETFSGALGVASPTGGGGNNVSQKNEIIVNVPSGLSPEEAAEATKIGTENAFEALFRRTDRAVSGPVLE